MNPKPDEISTAEAAKIAGISPATLRRYSSDAGGRGPYAPRQVRVGFYSRKQIKHWLANRPGRGARGR